jgi:putative aldouronate transport system substrate-binding protein
MNVVTQYLVPLQAGMVDNVDTAIDEFLKNAEAAGMDKLHELYIKQWYAHVDANNEWK